MAKTQLHKTSKNPSQERHTKGQEVVIKILDSAEKILMNKGYHSFSIRNIAAEANISISNLYYYYPKKHDLIQALFDKIIQRYLDGFQSCIEEKQGNAEAQFRHLITHIITDLNTKKTTVLFPEMWALANHSAATSQLVDAMYGRYRAFLEDIINEINPSLTQEKTRKLALFISSSLEGHTMFLGYKKPWEAEIPAIIELANDSFLHLVKTT